MRLRAKIESALVLLLVGACATAPSLPPAATQNGAAIGITIAIHPPLAPSHDAQLAYFVQVGQSGEPIDTVIHVSNYEKEGRVYFLNAPAGRYVAVAAQFSVMGSSYITYFDRAAIELSSVTVDAGKLAYAGSLTLDSAVFVCPDQADEAQLRYAEAIAPGVPKCGWIGALLHELATHPVVIMNSQAYTLGPSSYHYRGSLRGSRREAADLKNFLLHAKDDLRNAGWSIEPE